MGSGKYLKRAINKHGLESFDKELLFVFDNPGEMFAKEAELVNEDFLAEENTYNLRVGGMGGWDHVNKTGQEWLPSAREKALKVLEEKHKDPVFSEEVKSHLLIQNNINWSDPNYRNTHTERLKNL